MLSAARLLLAMPVTATPPAGCYLVWSGNLTASVTIDAAQSAMPSRLLPRRKVRGC